MTTNPTHAAAAIAKIDTQIATLWDGIQTLEEMAYTEEVGELWADSHKQIQVLERAKADLASGFSLEGYYKGGPTEALIEANRTGNVNWIVID